MIYTVRKYIYVCNCCGKETRALDILPDGWKELPMGIHMCESCAIAHRHSERIDLKDAKVGDKFLTRSGKVATLIDIISSHKRPYIFSDDKHVWATLWNGFVTSITPDDIISIWVAPDENQ